MRTTRAMPTVATLLLLAWPTAARGTDEPVDGDWLVRAPAQLAEVSPTTHPRELALQNGLVARVWRLEPNLACVAFDDLMTGASLLRSVRPEARVRIDGVDYDVGGLVGQPNHAFLRPEWVDAMTADPEALQLVGYEIGEPVERFAWKRVRHCAPDVQWPPPGVHLRFDFELPRLSAARLEEKLSRGGASNPSGRRDEAVATAAPASEQGRKRLFHDDLTELDEGWTLHASSAHERSSFVNEGKLGEICTPANTAVFAERALPEGIGLVEATIDAGTDRSASWGPGLAVVFEKGAVIKLNLRPGGGGYDGSPALGLFDGRNENARLGGRVALSLEEPWTLRLRVTEGALFCDAREGDGEWRSYGEVAREEAWGQPVALRVGKLDRSGGATDFELPGELVRCRVLDCSVWGRLDEASLTELRERQEALADVRVSVHYELYDGVPVLSKWLTVDNGGDRPITVDRCTSGIRAVVEHASWVEAREGVTQPLPRSLHVETNFAFSGMVSENANRHVVHWRFDPLYTTQVNYLRQNPCLLEVEPTYGPAQTLAPGERFESMRTFELVHDSTDRERRGLARRRMYRTIAPWVTENPLMMHMRDASPERVREAIAQCVQVGFEMLILSFGSGFDIEDESPENLARWREIADYAHSQGIEIGGYSLLSSRHVGGGNDVISPEGQRPTFGSAPALTSEWGQDYFRKLYRFHAETGFDLLEHDGSYPGDVDITARPPLQKGLDDSRWVQWRIIADFYQWCRGRGIYLNVPDYYYLSGSNKCGMGYREVNWSLPRDQQVIHTRQNIWDGTWHKTPSMGWMFVPLTQYPGGGAAATIEPLDEHRDHYERMLASNLALGVQACYRGPRLYDTDATMALVKGWVDWFKAHRAILESDLVHGRRADGRDLDWMLHVNPRLEEQGMLVVFNPLEREVTRTLEVDLYYTGLTDVATLTGADGESRTIPLARDWSIPVEVTVPAGGMSWYVITE